MKKSIKQKDGSIITLRIEAAEKEDKDLMKGIIPLFDSYKEKYDKKTAKKYYGEYFSDGGIPNHKVFVGIVDGKIISVIGYCKDASEVEGVYSLGWFYTHKKMGGKKIGCTLLKFVIAELKKKKETRKFFVETGSDPFYRPALSLYMNNGFRIEGILRDYYRAGEDKIILGKNINI